MKKILTDSGINGTFTGTVEVKFNYRKETKEVHNRLTHEEEKRTFNLHCVVGEVEGELIQSADFRNENLVWQFIDEIEKKVGAKLHLLARVPPHKSLTEQLKDNGYN